MTRLFRKFFRKPLPGRVFLPLTEAERAAYETFVNQQDTRGW